MRSLLALLALALPLILTGCATAPPVPGPDDRIPSARVSATALQTARNPSECEYVKIGEAARPVTLPPMTEVAHTGTVVLTLATNEGPLVVSLDRSLAPCAVNSFVSLAKQKYFDDTSCHRLADRSIFILQCGDPSGTGNGGPGYTFADEVTPQTTYPAGTIAMANSGPNSNGSQFFLVYQDSPLPPNYTVFGTFDVEGQALLTRIAVEGHDGRYEGGASGKPYNPARILSVTEGGQVGSPIPRPSSSGR